MHLMFVTLNPLKKIKLFILLKYMIMSYSSSESSFSSFASSNRGEFEIARVLASLGNNHAATVVDSGDSGGGGRGEAVEGQNGNNKNNNSWGFKGKRSNSSSSNKRNNNNNNNKETSLSLHSSTPSPLPFDLNVDQPCVFDEEDCEIVDFKMEDACESTEHGPATTPPHNGGRSRHNILTEAEKEARRIRRVLANRESARQTIRRRQAFHEELTRKAAELASENETLKRNKELAMKEFHSLQIANHDLKGKLSKTLGFKHGGENKGQPESYCPDHNPHSANFQQLIYRNLSATPFVLPSCMIADQEKVSMNINSGKLPLCILPCPVFLPMPNNNNNNNDLNQLSSLLLHDKDEGSSVDSRRLYSPCSVISCTHNCHLGLSTDDKTHGQSQSQNQSQARFGFSLDRGGEGQQEVPQNSCSTHPSSTNMNSTSVISENRKQRSVRKKQNTVAGADARKKRKELMKLKSRIHCQFLGREDG